MLFEQTQVGQAPTRAAPKADTETMWTGLLALIRALILGRRLPPDQLRSFLLFAAPVDYLSTAEVAQLLADNGEREGIEEDLPQGWTLGPRISAWNDGDDASDCEAQVIGETLRNLLRTEHPEWEHDWRCCRADDEEHLNYRVLDENRKVHPIACWMEGKVKLLREGQFETDPKALHDVVCYFLGNTIEWLLDETSGGLEECVLDSGGEDADLADILAFMQGTKDWTWEDHIKLNDELAEMVYASGQWEIGGYASPYDYLPMIASYMRNHAGHTQTKKLFAA